MSTGNGATFFEVKININSDQALIDLGIPQIWSSVGVTNNWQHWAFTKSSGTLRAFLDGVEMGYVTKVNKQESWIEVCKVKDGQPYLDETGLNYEMEILKGKVELINDDKGEKW